MASATPGTAVERLAGQLLDRVPAADPLADELTAWLSGSRRFRTFAEAHREKIRKKLRHATEPGARRDVRAELRAAHLLLADRRIELEFEGRGSQTGGPDFTVAFRGARSFELEVTRLHGPPSAAAFTGTLLTKLRQLPPSVPNAILVAIQGEDAQAVDVGAAIRAVRARADAKDEAFFADRGLGGTRGFYERLLRLGAVFTWCEVAPAGARAALWTNRSARIELPSRAAQACLVCLRDGQDDEASAA